MQDHYAGACAGIDMFHRVAKQHSRPEVRSAVARIAEEIQQDRQSLSELMSAVGAKPSVVKDVTARVGEKAARLKPNERAIRRSPLSDLLELEALTIAVSGKALGWKTLLKLDDPRLPQTKLEDLLARAERQRDELERLRLECADVLRQG